MQISLGFWVNGSTTGNEWFIQLSCDMEESMWFRFMMLLWRIWHCLKWVGALETCPSNWSFYNSSQVIWLLFTLLRWIIITTQWRAKLLAKHASRTLGAHVIMASFFRFHALGPLRLWAWSNLIQMVYFLDGSAGASMVLRDHLADITFSSCRRMFSYNDALEAEIIALMEGLSLVLQME